MASIFEGVKVIDFTAHVSGPACTAALADLGAEVIKIEPPVTGEATRALYPRLDGQALTYLWNNRGKKSVTIDMKDPEGISAVKELIKTADVVVENFRPGVMKKFGLDYDEVAKFAPGVVYCSISAFGQYGPDAMGPGFDILVQARSGIMDLTGEPEGGHAMKTSFHLLTPEQQDLRLMVREFADKEIIPAAKELDVTGGFPTELYRKAFEMGLTTMTLPEKYGGMGLDIFTYSLLKEEIARGDAGFAGAVAGSFMGSLPALLCGTDGQKNMVADCLNSGGIMAFALTEPESGSDSANMRTTYTVDGDSVILNGRKCFISNGGVADLIQVWATRDRSLGSAGISCFLVDMKTPGVSVGRHEDKMGYRTSATTDIVFEDARIPMRNMIGGEGEGMAIMNKALNRTRPTAGAGAIGNAQYAYEVAAEYSKVRTSFGGRPIRKFQGVAFMVADMYTQLEAARQLVWYACRCADAGIVDRKLFSAAKCFAADVGMKVCEDAIQVMGGYGYSREYPVEKRFRDAKLYQIFEGTNQIQRVIINSDLCKD